MQRLRAAPTKADGGKPLHFSSLATVIAHGLKWQVLLGLSALALPVICAD
jgi:hypothetical protein